MRTKTITPKQQVKIRAKFFRILASIGFQYQESEKGGYWWRKVNDTKRICVGFDVFNQCLGGRTNYIWQTTDLNQEPLFGYSGSCSVSASWGNANRLVDLTLERVYNEGMARAGEIYREKVAKIKQSVTLALDS